MLPLHYNVRPQVGSRELMRWLAGVRCLAGLQALVHFILNGVMPQNGPVTQALLPAGDEVIAICVWKSLGALGALEVAVVVMKFFEKAPREP